MNRQFASFISFLVVLGLYFVYGWVVIPLALPEREEDDSQLRRLAEQSEGEPREEMLPYLGLFPENVWERNPKVEIIRDSKTVIVFLDSEISGSKAILKPCTILLLSEDPELSQEEKIRRAIVLRTPDYAEVEFESELNFSQFPLPKMIGGKMIGPVIVQSDMEQPGPEDDLFLETRDVAFEETPAVTSISTINMVRFRLGHNKGQGSILRMETALSDPRNPKSSKVLNRIQFETLQFLNLCFPEESEERSPGILADQKPTVIPSTPATPQALAAGVGAKTASEAPLRPLVPLTARTSVIADGPHATSFTTGKATTIDVRCQREFYLRADNEVPGSWIAAFHGNVNVVRTNPDDTKDHVTGEELQINFQPKTGLVGTAAAPKGEAPKGDNAFGNLEPVKFRVLGRLARSGQPNVPARLISPQNGGITMTGDQILYDIRKNLLALETETRPGASPTVQMVLQNRYVINGEKGFQYQMNENGGFGTLMAGGKGNLKGNMGDEKTPKRIDMSWDKMQAEPYSLDLSQIQIHLEGNIVIDMEGFGKMNADKLDLWCRSEKKAETAPNGVKKSDKTSPVPGVVHPLGESGNLVPDRMSATGRVHFENMNGTCDVKQFQVYFKNIDGANETIQSRWLPYIMTQPPPSIDDLPQQPIRLAFDSPHFRGAVSSLPKIRQAQYQATPPAVVPATTGPVYAAPAVAAIPTAIPRTPFQSAFPQTQPVSLLPLDSPVGTSQGTPLMASARTAVSPAPPIASPPLSGMVPSVPHSNNVVAPMTPPSASSGSVSTQNLLGFHSGNARSQFAVTAERLIMIVQQEAKETPVQHLWLGGKVHVIEKVADVLHGDLIEINGSEVDIWKPSTPNTVIRITGNLPSEEAVFKGKGVQMNAMKVEIFRAENLIWVNSPGRLLTSTNNRSLQSSSGTRTTILPAGGTNSSEKLSPLTPLELSRESTVSRPIDQDDRLVVEWNGDMKFNGETMVFHGKPDRNGGRVLAYHQHQKMICDAMWIHLNRAVRFFDDQSNVPVEAETIDCAVDVSIENKQFDEQQSLKSYDRGRFEAVRIYVKSNDFVAEGPGYLRSTSLKGDKGFSGNSAGNMAGPFGSKASSDQVVGEGQLAFLCVWFQDYVRGNFYGNQKRAEISGRVQTVYCPVRSWDEIFEIDRITAATRLGYYLQCERLDIAQMPDSIDPKKSSVELTANQNAKIEGKTFYGQAETIKYTQAKNLVVFDKNAWVKSDQTELQPAQRIEYNTETGAVNTSFADGMSFGP